MKHNTLKKILSLLLVICMMASFAGCSPGEADPIASEPTQTSDETHAATEKPVAPTEAVTEPFTEAAETTTATEEETIPAIVEPATEPRDIPEIIFNDVDEIVYATSSVNIRFGPGTDYEIVGSLGYGQAIRRTGVGSNGWSRVDLNDEDAYPPGTRLELISMGNDPNPVPPGTRGTVELVNSLGDIEMKWDNGRSLSLIPGEDSFRKLTMEELAAEQDLGGMQCQTM